jgi:predicted protein tyrosine phosphatase
LEQLLIHKGTHFSHCISIGDPGKEMIGLIETSFMDYLRIEFHDINTTKDMPANENPVPPSMYDVKQVVRFFNATKNEATGYTIHCHAGIHRSAAVALAILYMITGNEKSAMIDFYKARALGAPNKQLIKLFDEFLGSNLTQVSNEMWGKMNGFMKGKIQIDHDDYLDELPAAMERLLQKMYQELNETRK